MRRGRRLRTTCASRHGSRMRRDCRGSRSTHRRAVLVRVRKSGDILSFRIGTAMMRMRMVLVTHAINKGNIPRVHAKEVIHVLNREIQNFFRFPALDRPCLGHGYIFQVLCYVVIRQQFKDVGGFVFCPPLFRIYGVCQSPNRIVSHRGPDPTGLPRRKQNSLQDLPP